MKSGREKEDLLKRFPSLESQPSHDQTSRGTRSRRTAVSSIVLSSSSILPPGSAVSPAYELSVFARLSISIASDVNQVEALTG